MTFKLAALAAVLSAGIALPATAQQGVTKDEIVLGTIQDLSGPIAGYGKQSRNGMQMYVDELNAAGGINGRKIKLLVEDNAYDPRKALLAAQKLVNSDKIFMMVGHIGSAHNMAAMPIQFEKNIINFAPITAAREMYLPAEKLKIALSPAYFDQLRILMPNIIKEKKTSRACVVYQDDEFGLEVMRGGEVALKAVGQDYVEKVSFKRAATDFSSQVAKMKAANCDLVVMGTIIRETVGVLAEAKKVGLNATFVGTSAAYTHLIHALAGPVADGLYAMMTTANPYMDDKDAKVRDWAAKYKAKFNEDPTVFSAYGYQIMNLFKSFAEKAQGDLTTDSFLKATETVKLENNDLFGGGECKLAADNRLCSTAIRLSQIRNGRWEVVSDWVRGSNATQ